MCSKKASFKKRGKKGVDVPVCLHVCICAHLYILCMCILCVVCVCVHVYCVYCVHVCAHIHVYECTVCMCVHVCMSLCSCVLVRKCILWTCACMCDACVCKCVHKYCVDMCVVCMHVCVYAYCNVLPSALLRPFLLQAQILVSDDRCLYWEGITCAVHLFSSCWLTQHFCINCVGSTFPLNS